MEASALAVLHPFPSALNGVLVVLVALVAGGPWSTAAALGAGMLCLHLAIGGLNDIVDAPHDERVKPGKPIPAGKLNPRAAWLLTGCAAGAGLMISSAHGPVTALLGAVVLGAGVAYDVALKPTPFASIPYAVAFTVLPLYAWYGAAGGPPPQAEFLLPVAALTGPALQLANGLVDLEADQAAGLRGPAVILGRVRATVMLILLQAVIHGLAWLSVAGQGPSVPAVVALAAGTTCAGVGVRLTAGRERGRERGWRLQAAGIVCLAFGWLLGVAGP